MDPISRLLPRYLEINDRNVGDSPMLFVTGPRQVGKTFEVRKLSPHYFNWDTLEVKKAFLKDPYFFRSDSEWIVFDEIHKKKKDWKRILKGYYDTPSRTENFIVTGSGRFNLYQRGGDSLQGRYDLFHHFPVTLDEYLGFRSITQGARDFTTWEPDTGNVSEEKESQNLIDLGGFPDPLLRGSKQYLNKWQDLYLKRLVEEDVRDFSKVELVDKLELFARLLPERLTSPLSHKSLSEDLGVSRDSVKSWVRLFETLYLGFSLSPYSKKIHRAVKREKKWYFFQWTFSDDPGPRFENYLATQLLTTCQYWRDQGFGTYELFYLRDQDRREVDFLITKNLKPVALVEAKASFDGSFPSSLRYYSEKLQVPGFLVYPKGPTRREGKMSYSLSAARFLRGLNCEA